MLDRFQELKRMPRACRVLVAADDAVGVANMELLLRALGYVVRASSDGADVVALAAEFHDRSAALELATPGLDPS